MRDTCNVIGQARPISSFGELYSESPMNIIQDGEVAGLLIFYPWL